MAPNTNIASHSIAAAKRRPFHQVLAEISLLFTAFPRGIRRSTIALPLGLVWRVSATLFVLIQHAERTDGDAETLRQARALHAALVQLQGHSTTVRSMPITSDSHLA